MTPKMVANFRRSLSFTNNPSPPSKPRKILHVRSTSLPCSRSHPLISHLRDDLTALKSWRSNPTSRTSAWLCDGLSRLKAAHDYLDDILHLPQTRDSLRHQPHWIENLLEDFLKFVDVFGIFQSVVLALKQENSAALMAVRRKEDSKIALYVKALKKLGTEMGQLVSTVRLIGKSSDVTLASEVDADLGGVIREVVEVTVLVSVSLFNGISVSLPEKTTSFVRLLPKKGKRERVEGGIVEMKTEWLKVGMREKGDEEATMMVLKKMHQFEECVAEIGISSERMFRSLINTRVSLLNLLTN